MDTVAGTVAAPAAGAGGEAGAGDSAGAGAVAGASAGGPGAGAGAGTGAFGAGSAARAGAQAPPATATARSAEERGRKVRFGRGCGRLTEWGSSSYREIPPQLEIAVQRQRLLDALLGRQRDALDAAAEAQVVHQPQVHLQALPAEV